MEAILFSTVFTAAVGYPYWRIRKYLTKPADLLILDNYEPTNQEIRQSPEYRQLRITVLKRDGFKCVFCNETQNLEVHHIYSFASFPEGRFDPWNCLTLCRYHHSLTPNYGSKEKAFSQRIINS